MAGLFLIRCKTQDNQSINVYGTPHVLSTRRCMDGILPRRRKTQENQSINQSINQYTLHSAGVGRTGTYIALDALYWEGKLKGTVNVSRFVKGMRNNRVSMVQTYVSIIFFIVLSVYFFTTKVIPLCFLHSTKPLEKIEKNK